jgi:2-dehydropantoate 2-reductase
MGVGSQGTILGAMAAAKGAKVTLIDANEAHVDALNKHGATIEGTIELKNVPVTAILPGQMEGVYDYVFLITKQPVNDICAEQLKPHMNENSTVVTLQNGVPEEHLDEIIGGNRVLGASVYWSGIYKGPGVTIATATKEHQKISIGELDGSITERLKTAAKFLEYSGKVDIVTNLTGIKWAKLLINATLSGMSAALNATYEDVINNEKALKLAAYVGNECVMVAHAKGIRLVEFMPGFDLNKVRFSDAQGLERACKLLHDYGAAYGKLKGSMLQDMEKGIRSEINQIDGVISDNGRLLGIPTPTTDTVVRIVTEFEEGNRPMPTFDALDEFTYPAYT